MNTINQEEYVNKIRRQYTEREVTKMDELRTLDRKVKRPAQIFAWVFGTAGALVLGTGMCLAMKVIGDLFVLGIGVGVVGIAMVSANYFLYKAVLKSRRRRYADRVMALSDELLPH